MVNLSQDKLSPDIAFYFKDPINLFQKMIEIENFQKLHRNRCMESAMKERYIEDILLLKAWRERAENIYRISDRFVALYVRNMASSPMVIVITVMKILLPLWID